MAVKLEKTKTMSGDSRYSIKLVVKETGTSGNSSTISYTLTATKSSGSGYYTSNSNNQVKITIDGTDVVNKKISYDFTGSTPKTITLASGTKSIEHNPDGTKAIACSGYFKDSNNSLGSATASGSLALTTLHKPPSARISGCSELQTALSSFVQNVGYKVVDNISVKQVTLTPTLYDDASVSNYNVSSGEVSVTSSTSPLYMNFINKIGNIYYQIITTDNKGGVGTDTSTWTTRIPYTKPTIVASNFTAKRQGQLTGNVRLVANGTYYLNQGALTQNITPTIKYSIKDKSTSTYIVQDQTATITASNGNWSMDFTINSIFQRDKAYEVELVATDNLIEAVNSNLPSIGGTQVSPITKATATKVVPIGEPTWTEYKDRVDFKKLTIDKQQILAPYLIYENDTGDNGTITLDDTDDSFANYEYIEVFYKTNDDDYKSTKVYKPNGKYVLLDASAISGNYTYVKTAHYSLSGNTMTLRSNMSGQARIGNNVATTWNDNSNRIYITRILGYK